MGQRKAPESTGEMVGLTKVMSAVGAEPPSTDCLFSAAS